jgi:hypothetical protein
MPAFILRCITCNTVLSPWGTTQAGTKRYYCRLCKTSSTRSRKKILSQSVCQLFKAYVLWGDTYEQLSSLSGYSIRQLYRLFIAYLKENPPYSIVLDQSQTEETFLLIDGLWFGRWFVLMVYRQSKNLTILHISVAGKEVASKITKDLQQLLTNGYRFTGIVSDGGTGIVSAVQEVFPHSPHQICLAHMHRRIIASLGRYPKDYRVQELRELADWVWRIESKQALFWWNNTVKKWKQRNVQFLQEYHRDETGRWWYVHTGVRKALRMLLTLPHTSFTFLDHPLMPKTTNELEASLGHLAKRWVIHRGLKKERWEQFMKWFVYFYNLEKQTDKKQKRDI